jgi:endoglucanase
VNVPLRYMHTPVEVLDLDDLDAAIKLLAAVCCRIEAGLSFIPE